MPELSFRDCNAVLQNDHLNTIISDRSKSLYQNFLSYIEKTSYEDFQKAKSNGLNVGFTIPIKGVPIGINLGSNNSKATYQKLQESIRSGQVEEIAESEMSHFVQQYETVQKYEAYIECVKQVRLAMQGQGDGPLPPTGPPPIKDPSNSEAGIEYTIENFENTIAITLKYNPFNNKDPYPIVQEFFYSKDVVECVSSCLQKGDELSDERTIVFKRIGNDSGFINIDTDKGTVKVPIQSQKTPPLSLKVFFLKNQIQPTKASYSNTLPSGYKILSLGFNTQGLPANVTSIYPQSQNEYVMKVTSKPEQCVVFTNIVAMYDPQDEWDVKVFQQKINNKLEINCEIDKDYIITGGGISFEPKDANGLGYDPNVNSFSTSISSIYPKDIRTWKVELNGDGLNDSSSWELTSYAIALKQKGKLEGKIFSSGDLGTQFLSPDPDYVAIGGGIDLAISQEATTSHQSRILSTGPFNNDTSAALNGIPKGYEFNWNEDAHYKANITKFIIGIKHPEHAVKFESAHVDQLDFPYY
ncbi:hypothetical protein CON11_26705 [Priestia megaterium]|uniref:hypothetical protein n=1 Tax=Priestia megaterium TaxID=1404 RepID=UPI000BEB5B2D|nr:hypothetical protein [Priestia megaterium]PEC41746.1 hypothetical protein CON11_26705 [Priestia megaterium]